MSYLVFSVNELCNYFINNGCNLIGLTNYLSSKFELSGTKLENAVSSISKNFISKFNYRWIKASRTRDRFVKNNKQWLDSEFKVIFNKEQPYSSGQLGRPSKIYGESSEKNVKIWNYFKSMDWNTYTMHILKD